MTTTKTDSRQAQRRQRRSEATGAPLFPLMLKLEGRLVLVVGGGAIASSKTESLLDAGARVRLVAPEREPHRRWSDVEYHPRRFQPSDLEGCWLAISAATPEVNREVARHAERRRVLAVAADDPENCSAYGTAVLRRGALTLAISTEGTAPALAGLLREALQELLPIDVDDWMHTASSLREDWRRAGTAMEERRPLLLRALERRYHHRGASPGRVEQ